MNPATKNRLLDVLMGIVAILVGAGIIYMGDWLLGIRLEYFFGVSTFSPIWVLDLFVVPFIAGTVVSLIYGLGGKILAHLSPVLVRVISFYELHNGMVPPEGVIVVPTPYWLLIVVIAAEFAAFGGVVGEIIVKRTYGRTANKALLHRKYRKGSSRSAQQQDVLEGQKRPAESVDS